MGEKIIPPHYGFAFTPLAGAVQEWRPVRTRGEFTFPLIKGYTGKCRNLRIRLGTTAAEIINRMYQRYIILITHRVLTSPHVVGGRRKPLGILPSGEKAFSIGGGWSSTPFMPTMALECAPHPALCSAPPILLPNWLNLTF